jgi:hypothetical protein
MGVEIGLKQEADLYWLRWWDESGNLLLTGDERAAKAETIANQASQRADQAELAKQQAEALLQKYRDRFGDISE